MYESIFCIRTTEDEVALPFCSELLEKIQAETPGIDYVNVESQEATEKEINYFLFYLSERKIASVSGDEDTFFLTADAKEQYFSDRYIKNTVRRLKNVNCQTMVCALLFGNRSQIHIRFISIELR